MDVVWCGEIMIPLKKEERNEDTWTEFWRSEYYLSVSLFRHASFCFPICCYSEGRPIVVGAAVPIIAYVS